MKRKSTLPLIIFDAVLNFYLTLLFVVPLRKLYSYKNSPNSALRTITLRSFVGSLATLTSSVVNLTVLMILKGEAAWICLMCCNADVLFSVLVLHWVTSKDKASTASSNETHTGYISSQARRTKLSSSRADDSVVDKLGVFSSGKGGLGSVTTHISAQDLKRERVKESIELTGRERSFPLDRIKVQVGRSVQVESESRSEVGDDNTEFKRGGSGTSIENLVEQREQSWLSTPK